MDTSSGRRRTSSAYTRRESPRWAEIEGGGALYAVALDGHDRVYELPPGGIEGGCYRGAAVLVADRFEDFLGQIRQRLREALS